MANRGTINASYEVDVMFVPDAGPECREAFTRFAIAAGSSWPVNTFAFSPRLPPPSGRKGTPRDSLLPFGFSDDN